MSGATLKAPGYCVASKPVHDRNCSEMYIIEQGFMLTLITAQTLGNNFFQKNSRLQQIYADSLLRTCGLNVRMVAMGGFEPPTPAL